MKISPFKKWPVKQKVLVIGILVLVVLVLPIGGSILNLWHNKSELRRLTARREKLDAQYEQLLAEKNLLQTQDPAYMQMLARVRYNMVKPGEIEYRFSTHD